MTNKSLFIVIFSIAIVGLLGSVNIIYTHLSADKHTQENSVSQLNQKLHAAENQIRLIVNENNALRVEIDNLKNSVSKLTKRLKQYNVSENKPEVKAAVEANLENDTDSPT